MANETDKKISELTERTQLTGEEMIPVAEGGQNYRVKVSTIKEYAQPDTQERRYALAEWDEEELDPDARSWIGEPEMLNEWFPFLLDTTDNTGVATTPVGQLKRNNYLRFEDGTFAPTIGITEEQRAQCDVELYLNPEHTEKYCDAGTFDAEAFYNQYGMSQKLYNASGEEITHILRPWETTETKYTIGIGRKDTVYLIDQIRGKSGKVWRGLSTTPSPFDGIDASQWKLVPTAISPCPVCTVGGKSRNFFYLYEGEQNCQSSAGMNSICTMFKNGRTYPRTNVSQISAMQFGRANNADTEKPYPFAEGGFHAYNTFITAMEVMYGTKALHKDTMFSSGISSNDSCADEASWKLHGGVRYKLTSDGTWKYSSWNANNDIYYAATQKSNFTVTLNQEYPKEQCMESQMAASFAVETGVAEGEEFAFYGGTYWYETPVGAQGLKDGRMNVRVYKVMSQTLDAYDSEGAQASWDVETVLRMPLTEGMNLSGDVLAYWGGGSEMVGTCAFDPVENIGNPMDLYLQPDQTKWAYETDATKDDLGTFPFEESYIKIGSAENIGNGYATARASYSPFKTANGGAILSGECFYGNTHAYWVSVLNQCSRIGSRFRGYAHHASCSPRYLHAFYAVLHASRHTAGSAQALIQVGAAPPQAE